MAVTLNGSSQYLSGGPDYEIPTTVSISWWMQQGNWSAARVFMGRTDSGGSSGWNLTSTSGDSFSYNEQYVGGSETTGFDFGAGLSADTWVHFLYVRNATNRRMWRNGSLVTNTGTGTYVNVTPTVALALGAQNAQGTFVGHWLGKLAEVAIWDGVDVGSLVTDLYTGAAEGKAPNNIGSNPTYYWKLIADGTATLGGLDLTANGSPSFDSSAHTGLTIDYGGGGGGAETLFVPRRRWVYRNRRLAA